MVSKIIFITSWTVGIHNNRPRKTRLLLNYKGLDYKTEWVEYPDIKPRLEKQYVVFPTHPAQSKLSRP